jgi:hypothetical protein
MKVIEIMARSGIIKLEMSGGMNAYVPAPKA